MKDKNINFGKIVCIVCIACFFILVHYDWIFATNYQDSAHGENTGVNRTSMSGYSIGNCSHCHEQHASVGGDEPAPSGGAPSEFVLFSDNFNITNQTGPYVQSDNFCFQCHISTGGFQSGGGITNKQYANVFGGYDTDSAVDIFGAFNLNSFHNLYNIQSFAADKFSFFKSTSNPCVACHNPHLARRHKDNEDDPTYSTISLPSAHEEIWGDGTDERMNNYTYRPPYYYESTTTYEPGGITLHDGTKTIDYNAFCLDCHQYEVPVSTTGVVSMNSNTTPGYLTAINWSVGGDMHGARPRIQNIDGSPKGFGSVIAPYNEGTVESNYVLSCLDCHDPHASVLSSVVRTSSYLLRKEVNGKKVQGSCGPDDENFCELDFCLSCHTWSHCGGSQGCLVCHFHGAENQACGAWTGPNF